VGFLRGIFAPVPFAEAPGQRLSLRIGSLDRFDRWTLSLVAVVFLLLLVRMDALKPSMSDTWYHLGVAKQIVKQKQIPGWDEWNYAPTGRPHLYPPLLHLVIAFLSLFTGGIVQAGQLCAATFFPLAMLSIWYCARRLLDSRVALLACVVLMADLFHFVVMQAYIASCLVNILMPMLMVTFLARRPWWSILLMTLMYYSHLGFPHCVALGLLLFGLKYRAYLRLAVKVVSISLIFFTPWLSHVLGHLDWLAVLEKGGMPGSPLQKILSLQSFNLVLLGLGFWGISIAPRKVPGRMLPVYLLLSFLPILFTYGGRYTMHTMPCWAMLAASVLSPLLPPFSPPRRIFGLLLLPLLPVPSVGIFGKVTPIPFTAAHVMLMLAATGKPPFAQDDKNEAYGEDCDQLVHWLNTHTAEGEIIHVNKIWVANMISLLSDHPTDYGAWWECSKETARLYNQVLRDWSLSATFASLRPEADVPSPVEPTVAMPGVDSTVTIGRFVVGVRRPRRVVPVAVTLRFSPLVAAGAYAKVEMSQQRVRWSFRPYEGTLALITAPLPRGQWAGVSFQISATTSTGELVFGVRTADGGDFRWPLAVPQPHEFYKVRVIFDWMTDAENKPFSGVPVQEIYFAYPPHQSQKGRELQEWSVDIVDLAVLVERPDTR
jgi:hypothetical protein